MGGGREGGEEEKSCPGPALSFTYCILVVFGNSMQRSGPVGDNVLCRTRGDIRKSNRPNACLTLRGYPSPSPPLPGMGDTEGHVDENHPPRKRKKQRERKQKKKERKMEKNEK